MIIIRYDYNDDHDYDAILSGRLPDDFINCLSLHRPLQVSVSYITKIQIQIDKHIYINIR